MDFRVLGPVEMWQHGIEIPLDGSKQRTVLAALLLARGRLVSDAVLSAMLWGERPPTTVNAQIYTYVSRLRKCLGSDGAIVRRRPGYLLRFEADSLDLEQFERLSRRGREALRCGQYDAAAHTLRQALGYWRGTALANVTDFLVDAQGHHLEEARLQALEGRIEADLQLGRHHQVVAELTGLVEEYPLRERLRAQLMTSLYQGDRQSEALTVYHQGRELLRDEVGSDPGPTLAGVYRAILNGQSTITAREVREQVSVASPPRPAMLPLDLSDFTGRDRELAQTCDLLRAGPGAAVPDITGMVGVGKTALAIHAAHAVLADFPDGQLYADLSGAGDRPADPFDVLGVFLRALHVDESTIPGTLSGRTQLYRSLLADRQMLIVLDSALTDTQVIPLLPGGSRSRVIVASRSRIVSFGAVALVELEPFDAVDSGHLLTTVVGHDRVRREPAALDRLMELCGRLPLSLRIAAVRLAAKPHWTLSRLCERLSDERTRLAELRIGTWDVRESLRCCYRTLAATQQSALRRLSMLDIPDFPAWAVAEVLGEPEAVGEEVAESLVDARMLDVATVEGQSGRPRHRFHDLIRIFARECAAEEESTEDIRQALDRTFRAWLSLARQAAGLDRSPNEASQARLHEHPDVWFEYERPTLVALAHQAAGTGRPAMAADLNQAIASLIRRQETALVPARRATASASATPSFTSSSFTSSTSAACTSS